VNPNQVLRASAGVGFSIADATSICLPDCPALLPAGALSWVCKYPNSEGVAWVDAGAVPSLEAWASQNYDYFAQLNSTFQASSCELKGPCWPVLTPQLDSHHTCQYEALNDVPLNVAAVAAFQQCVSCCEEASPEDDAACTATDGAGNPNVWSYDGNTSTPNGYIMCLNSCQTLHQSIASFVADTTQSISPEAYALYTTTCAAATGCARCACCVLRAVCGMCACVCVISHRAPCPFAALRLRRCLRQARLTAARWPRRPPRRPTARSPWRSGTWATW
jgi:hypothetical protein